MDEVVNIIKKSNFSILYYDRLQDREKLLSSIPYTCIEDNGFNFLSSYRDKKIEYIFGNKKIEGKIVCDIQPLPGMKYHPLKNFIITCQYVSWAHPQNNINSVSNTPMSLHSRADLVLVIKENEIRITKNRYGKNETYVN